MTKQSPKTAKKIDALAISGLFLSLPDSNIAAHYWDAVRTSALDQDIDLDYRQLPPQRIAMVVPPPLMQDAESWLVLYKDSNRSETLVVPYPEQETVRRLSNFEERKRHAFLALEEIRGQRDQAWFPSRGYGNLGRLARDRKRREQLLLDLERFQLIHSHKAVDEILTQHIHTEGETRLDLGDTYKQFSEVLQETQERRRELLSGLIQENRPDRRSDLVSAIDEELSRQNERLFSTLTAQKWEIVPEIVSRYGTVLEEESKRFLISTETVKQFAFQHGPTEFDYSLPASGLWKTAELELNASVMWCARHCHGIADLHSPWLGDTTNRTCKRIKTGPEDHHWFDLNERLKYDASKFRSRMLGEILHMLRFGYQNGLKKAFTNLQSDEMTWLTTEFLHGPKSLEVEWNGTLPWVIHEVTRFRNSHAHVSSMSRKKYEQFETLLFEANEKNAGYLHRLLEVKKRVLHYMESERQMQAVT